MFNFSINESNVCRHADEQRRSGVTRKSYISLKCLEGLQSYNSCQRSVIIVVLVFMNCVDDFDQNYLYVIIFNLLITGGNAVSLGPRGFRSLRLSRACCVYYIYVFLCLNENKPINQAVIDN